MVAEGRVLERAARPACDFRAIFCLASAAPFIVNAYLSLPGEIASLLSSPAEVDDEVEQDALAKQISTIHARWLLTPR